MRASLAVLFAELGQRLGVCSSFFLSVECLSAVPRPSRVYLVAQCSVLWEATSGHGESWTEEFPICLIRSTEAGAGVLSADSSPSRFLLCVLWRPPRSTVVCTRGRDSSHRLARGTQLDGWLGAAAAA